MELNDILTLGKMGFTAQQVASFAQMQKAQPQQMAQMQPQQMAQMQPQQMAQMQPQQMAQMQPQQMAQMQPQQMAQMQQIDPLVQQINALTTAVQASSILASQQPKQETADDVLASIINPPILTGQDKK